MIHEDKYKNLAGLCLKELHSCVEYVQHYSENKEKCLNDLLEVAKEHCLIDINHKKALQASREAEEYFDNHENDCTESVEEKYEEILANLSEDESFENHSIWKSTKRLISKEASTEKSDDEEDVVADESVSEGIVPSQFQPPVDPITKQVIRDPCKNKKCGHIYEYTTIMGHMNNMRNKKFNQCPYIGCSNNKMKPSFIVRDKSMQQRIEQYFANQSQMSGNSLNDISTANID